MKLSKQEVENIARLARLQLTANEVERFRGELSQILDYVEQLQAVATVDVPETTQVTGLLNVKREDRVDYNYSREEILASAIEAEENHLKVKNVF